MIPVDPHPHPTEFIDDELTARGWTREMLITQMEPHFTDMPTNSCRLVVDMYWEIGPQEPNCRMGQEMADAFSKVFGISAQYFLNLEKGWLQDSV